VKTEILSYSFHVGGVWGLLTQILTIIKKKKIFVCLQISFTFGFILFCREAQMDIKKWQVKEAEKQRVVKINAADWVDHPDRYLLELAGRPVYNNSAS